MAIDLEDKNLLASQSASRSMQEWVGYFDNKYTKNQIYSFCYRNNYPLRKLTKKEINVKQSNNSRKYNINQDYFKTWSRNMAYILGFWFADGCIYGGKMFDITLHKKDKYILKQIANELSFEGKLYDYVDRQASRLNFSCVVIYNDIKALGGTENKGLTIDFPKIPKEFLSDFIRGYFDGNGSIMLKKKGRINSAFTCGSKRFLIKLLEILKKEAGIEGGSFDDSSYSLKFGKKDTYKLGKYMYQNNPELFLKRKQEKFFLILKEEI